MQASQLEVERYSEGRSLGWRGTVPHFVLHGQVVKSCRSCGRVLPLESFPDDPSTWDAQSRDCLDCYQRKP